MSDGMDIIELQEGSRWSSNVITFSFLDSIPSYYSENDYEGMPARVFQSFTPEQRAATLEVLAEIERVANITFVEVPQSESALGDITFGLMDRDQNLSGWTSDYPGADQGGDVWMNVLNHQDAASGAFRHTLVHEIGHALGLKHPHDPAPRLPGAEDSQKYTMMSYDSHPDYLDSADRLMLYDIAVLQHLFGANNSTNTGDDLYGTWDFFEIHSIWDAAGDDTISAESATANAVVDLRQGFFSTIADGTYKDNVSIGFGAIIENAIGSVHDDYIIGNFSPNTLRGEDGDDAIFGDGPSYENLSGFPTIPRSYQAVEELTPSDADDDTIYGGAGNDSIYGGSGNDALRGDDGHDLAYGGDGDDLVYGGAGDDTLYGGEGLDFLYGDEGSNVLDGGDDIDTVDYSSSPETIKMVFGALEDSSVLRVCLENHG